MAISEGIRMKNQYNHVHRQGQLYRFSLGNQEYVAFIWRTGTQFRGRLEGYPAIPEHTAHTALGVRDALQQVIAMAQAKH